MASVTMQFDTSNSVDLAAMQAAQKVFSQNGVQGFPRIQKHGTILPTPPRCVTVLRQVLPTLKKFQQGATWSFKHACVMAGFRGKSPGDANKVLKPLIDAGIVIRSKHGSNAGRGVKYEVVDPARLAVFTI